MAITAYTDGASLGNPGPMGIGIVLYKSGKLLLEVSEYAGQGTNNQAEYLAVIRALELAKQYGEDVLHVRTDSELVVKQLKGEYKVKNSGLKPLRAKIAELSKGIDVHYEHVPRERNKTADKLSKEGAKRHESRH